MLFKFLNPLPYRQIKSFFIYILADLKPTFKTIPQNGQTPGKKIKTNVYRKIYVMIHNLFRPKVPFIIKNVFIILSLF